MQERIAIIDIGYNAIRAVVYESNHPGAPEIFNNKFKSDILSLLSNDSLDIKHPSYLSIQYLLHIFNKLEVVKIHCVATAVLREHERAEELIQHIKKTHDFDIQILSGEEEARLTALGLVYGINDCDGVAADLGGGSLELIEINEREIGKLVSLELGTKMISARNLTSVDEITNIILEEYGDQTYENLYLIGGAMRFIGRLYLDFIDHPIKNLHNLEIDTQKFLNYLTKATTQSGALKNKIGKRKINLNAILVARAMIEVFQPSNIIISTYGLKEGVRFKSLEIPLQNITESKLAYACNYDLEKTDFDSYFQILTKIIPQSEGLYELLKFSIILTNLNKKIDQTLPPKVIVEYILAAEIPFRQSTRVMLALISNTHSDFKPSSDIIDISKKLISKDDYINCQIIGHFLAITEAVDGLSFKTPSFSINITDGYYEIKYENILPRPIFEKIRLRLKNMAYVNRNRRS